MSSPVGRVHVENDLEGAPYPRQNDTRRGTGRDGPHVVASRDA
jgi:hypothetical protein